MTTTTTNPLLIPSWLPPFKSIKAELVEPAIRQILQENEKGLNKIVQEQEAYTWKNLIQAVDDLGEHLSQAWSPVSHLHSVMQSDALRDSYNACLPLITEYQTNMMQHQGLYQAIKTLSESPEAANWDFAQKKLIKNSLRDFHLSGVDLSADKKERFLVLEKELSQLCTRFSEQLLDATHHWFLTISDQKQLAGLPESALELAAQNAKERKVEGWVLGLDYPSYSAAIKYLDDRSLRQQLYEASVTRASDQGPEAGKFDNSEVMDKILSCRQQLSALLGFNNYAEYSLATKMAKEPQRVMSFLQDLLAKCKPYAKKELAELQEFAKKSGGPAELAPWDLAYYAEKLRQAKYHFSAEEVKPYFPIQKVMQGLFALVSRIYGLEIKEREGVETWHPEVTFFDIHDQQGEYRGGFFIDLYARPKKREGAWMDECRGRRRINATTLQNPIAYLVCNFTPAVGSKPALLTHDEVLTLFHEFGHCLHHLLTRIDYPGVAGISGVPWDAVEFPSQFMELFFWEDEILGMVSGHYLTGEALPKALHQKMKAAKNFHSGLHMLRQLEFALFDFRMHWEYAADKKGFVQQILNEVRKETALLPVPSYNRFQHSFAHIFAGGYAAGYYSYAWADVLSCDAYGRFEEEGVLNPAVGKAFMQAILEKGGACEPLEAFVAFRGREPGMEALLRQNGWD